MIAYIKGKMVKIQEDSVVIDVNGIGYEIICANPFSFQSFMNKEAIVHTYHYVREDSQILYGFKNEDEKYLFIKLISVSGIGPKGALGILGSVDIPAFVSAIEQEDDKFLTTFPGVGKKTARQIILDLKGKLNLSFSIGIDQEQDSEEAKVDYQTINEVQEVLKSLGYSDKEIRLILPELKKEPNLNVDEAVRKALSLLMKG
ncbi:Holliday junction branch migration protein RuvA [Oceanobacillus caeni]|uniref:Holliday junction branch migration protein RuvA n=1 Tax=Oceanobacillus TaxID=182709 RepID=UPI00062159D5|nr:Holliday junction branch migration protein RuvA [Oceanobacillus caeni]KKE80535.1 ATP-dependent DNA helicase RuvA [Bacilli bacterium VT-13-104]PZD87768.1 Holliday junction branch migration protein RuvA [Bacilli bacterium]MBU8789535.1 Holliday junction branch migration protein RuvA [Oceanobacillus caeni]MCR1833946.1 Holliday junction branch migration protein RuvA [Oceanobacillus caeni]PZD89055.1 Holliday junction branch migration protein RuvA [Bacilli bacterium]